MATFNAGITPEQQIQMLLRENIAGLSLSTVILIAALAALTLWIARSTSKERILLWFGLLALVYGLRELARNPLIDLTFATSVNTRDLIVSWGDFLILIPGMLFLEEVFGRGWQSSIRWAVWVLIVYAAFGIALGVATGEYYYLPEPSKSILSPLLLVLLLLNWVKRYRPPQFADIRIFLLGNGIFVAFVLDTHFLPERYHAEPLGFFAFICSLGLIAMRRTVRNEKRLFAVEQEMAAAQRIQSSILPDGVPQVPGLTIAARYSPMTSVAGDFYDFALVDSSSVGILIADVAGHGVPAALIASMVKVGFATQQTQAHDPGSLLSELNQIFCQQIRGHYVTAGYLLINTCASSAIYSGAGHPPLVVWRAANREIERYENNGLFLGLKPTERYPNVRISLSSGDRLMLCTDGLLEATNEADENFGDYIDSRIAVHWSLAAPSFADALLADLRAWRASSGDHKQDDDLTLLVIDIGKEKMPNHVRRS